MTTDTPITAAEMREAAAKCAIDNQDCTPWEIADCIRAIPLPSDDEAVERVARAVKPWAGEPCSYPCTASGIRCLCADRCARAAIAAMRDGPEPAKGE